MERICRHCKQDISDVPPTEAITRHIVGLCAPSHNEVEAALREINDCERNSTEGVAPMGYRDFNPNLRATSTYTTNQRAALGLLKILAVSSILLALVFYLFMFFDAMDRAEAAIRAIFSH